ncbi:RdgB/HAM1 family non-canonical purine NTP pyrophosphatase [Porphyromonas circumdentaria]|uniref:dITP/XTP pyrophosphatase n=1 Tax=Porphyromonas circumdentaria TaxID=29524 RepID=A0A1T4MHQ0_9PORP|nr:RdgB/HAM1 family non-canonical purine NTP pyrophosphatase [Porphyromonas circumdentaria]MBB6275749.1 XTP/dITP diphosphohydrolase [Porphyromonas circumdentaria]MDO4721745.1 RdgB/HAM1 family non-canonical purine NTP pyrophosphatase [Porphyromonas circumdentaria]SJZ66443.1 XTP/dITP diphosphohydrolase [Porphyromonas circumdentaria]
MKKLILASNNSHKIEEVKNILSTPYVILSPKEIGVVSDPEESADTLEGNALIKVRALYQIVKAPCFADDTGLEVELLNGAPGVRSARYASPEHDDKANRSLLLRELSAYPMPHKARFRTVIAYIDSMGREHLFEGVVKGEIIEEERGTMGFGYDSIFIPEGETRTFAEMNEEEKNCISHRYRAVLALKEFLDSNAVPTV